MNIAVITSKLRQQIVKREILLSLLIIVLGFLVRFAWDTHQIVWSYDQARDSFVMREMARNFDIKLIGPQTEYYGLFHGPLYYYLLSPFYQLSRGNVELPLVVNALIVISSGIPLSLLVRRITKNKWATPITFFVFLFSYQFIEYSRWLSNVTISIPFLSWAYYFLYRVLEGKGNVGRLILFLGISLGLAVQGELFFSLLAVVILIGMTINKLPFRNILLYLIGLGIGTLPLIVSEIKFGFRGTRILVSDVLLSGRSSQAGINTIVKGYFEHVELTMNQVLGISGLVIGIVSFTLMVYYFVRVVSTGSKTQWIFIVLSSHAILFIFAYVNSSFLDLGLAVILVVITSFIYVNLAKSKICLALVILLSVVLQGWNYSKYLDTPMPFGHFGFIQQSSTLMHKEQVLDAIYNYANGREFSFASVGTPFGVRTVWASVFELYVKDHDVEIPQWYGYYANGYPGEQILSPSKMPADLHVLILESNVSKLVPDRIIDEHMGNQNTHTYVENEIVVNDNIIQFRRPING